ncbi:MAG: DUF559 domain-containing protein [Stenotrophobium sp.]
MMARPQPATRPSLPATAPCVALPRASVPSPASLPLAGERSKGGLHSPASAACSDHPSPSPACGRGAGERAAPQARKPSATNRKQLGHAKALRTNQTDAEQKLWHQLRGHRFLGLKFKRQKLVGRYIVDFVCIEHRFIIVLDGGQHNENPADVKRDAFLHSQGYRVLRFWNDDALLRTEAVLEAICLAIGEAPSPLDPLPRTGEGNKS